MLWPSRPIQEVDIYRYLWDGEVTVAGVSPFRFSPQQIRDAQTAEALPDDLAALVSLRDDSPAVAEVLARVHYPELPTIYPSVSQACFAAAALTTPREADVWQRVAIMKAWFLALDMGVIGVVILLLRFARMPWGWSVAYAWCPLVMKEFANSGHLDVIAVLLTVLALYFVALARERLGGDGGGQRGGWESTVAVVLLGLAVGAKLYPIVLAPLLALIWIRQFGAKQVAGPAVAFAATVGLVLWPMLPNVRDENRMVSVAGADAEGSQDAPIDRAGGQDPSAGLQAFLSRWEMNDFVFLVVYENLRGQEPETAGAAPWFRVVPPGIRDDVLSFARRWAPDDADGQAFLVARLLTLALFGMLAIWFAWRASASGDLRDWLEAAFLTLAWFWLLSPTQNPWYWTWALPLVPFARGRAWLLVSGVVLLYYLRFWLTYHFPETPVPPTHYAGPAFFDFVVTWIEHGTLLVVLAVEWLLRGWRRRGAPG